MGTKEEYETRKGKTEAENDKKKWWFKKSDPLAKFTGWLVFVTGLLFIATVGLYWATRDLVHDAEKTAERQLRAYLSVTGVIITNLEIGKRPVAQITLNNAGQTPANHVHRWADPIVLNDIPAPNYVPIVMPTYTENSGTPVAPGGSYYITAFFDRELTDLEMNAIKSKRYAMYVKGIVTYSDIFNVKRTTRFYASFGGPGTGTNDTGAMAPMDEGNEAD